VASLTLTQQQRDRARYLLPAAVAGIAAWLALIMLGETPLIRASGMALVIVGMALALRPMGALLSVIGGLALAFSPSFWVQTGGAEMLVPSEVLLTMGLALGGGLLILWLSKRPFVGIALAVIIFAALFLAAVGTPRSLRLTTLLAAWSLFLLVDGLLISNPRPDSPPTGELAPHHTLGLLLLLAIGVLNDPLFVLFAPAVVLGLFLSNKTMPIWYWLILIAVIVYGARGMIALYIDTGWWLYPSARAEMAGLRVPYVMADGWRETSRWLRLIELVTDQFTAFGLALGVLGLARLSRWYPPVGVVTMIAYGSFAAFGLVYFGADAPVLLLPLLMIQVLWMTYAAYSFSQWLQKSASPAFRAARWLAPAVFTLLPLLMLLRIAGVL
jgi:hypothetical protein